MAAGELGVNPVSQAIGLDYVKLKRRLTGSSASQAEASSATAGPTFVELPITPAPRTPECVIEFEGLRGKFMMRLAGHNPADLVALAEALSRT